MNPELTGYLLGTLPEERREEIAQRLLTDRDLFHELELLEIDLIDSYARGALNKADAERVRERLLGSRHGAEQLRVSQALVARRPARARGWMAIAAMLAAMVGGLWWWFVPPAQRMVDAPAAIMLDLAAKRGNDRVPRMRAPASGAVVFELRTGATIPDGAVANLRGPDGRAMQAVVKDRRFEIGAAVAGRYEIEVRAGGELVEAGEFDLVR